MQYSTWERCSVAPHLGVTSVRYVICVLPEARGFQASTNLATDVHPDREPHRSARFGHKSPTHEQQSKGRRTGAQCRLCDLTIGVCCIQQLWQTSVS